MNLNKLTYVTLVLDAILIYILFNIPYPEIVHNFALQIISGAFAVAARFEFAFKFAFGVLGVVLGITIAVIIGAGSTEGVIIVIAICATGGVFMFMELAEHLQSAGGEVKWNSA